MKKQSLNNAWGRALSNRLRSYLNLPPVGETGDGLLNTVIGEDEYLLSLEAAAEEGVALLSLLKKTEPFLAGRQLRALLEQAGINKYLPVPVHVAFKAPDRLVVMARISAREEHQAAHLLDTLFTVYADADNNR